MEDFKKPQLVPKKLLLRYFNHHVHSERTLPILLCPVAILSTSSGIIKTLYDFYDRNSKDSLREKKTKPNHNAPPLPTLTNQTRKIEWRKMHQDAWKPDEYIHQRDEYIFLVCLLWGIFLIVRAEQRLGFSQIQSENQKQSHELILETKWNTCALQHLGETQLTFHWSFFSLFQSYALKCDCSYILSVIRTYCFSAKRDRGLQKTFPFKSISQVLFSLSTLCLFAKSIEN